VLVVAVCWGGGGEWSVDCRAEAAGVLEEGVQRGLRGKGEASAERGKDGHAEQGWEEVKINGTVEG
jgi:hypothetical protein